MKNYRNPLLGLLVGCWSATLLFSGAASADASAETAYCDALTRQFDQLLSVGGRSQNIGPGTTDRELGKQDCEQGRTAEGQKHLQAAVRAIGGSPVGAGGDPPVGVGRSYCDVLTDQYDRLAEASGRNTSVVPGRVERELGKQACAGGRAEEGEKLLQEAVRSAGAVPILLVGNSQRPSSILSSCDALVRQYDGIAAVGGRSRNLTSGTVDRELGKQACEQGRINEGEALLRQAVRAVGGSPVGSP